MTRLIDDSRQGHHRSGAPLSEVHTRTGSGWRYGLLLFLMAGAILGAAIATLNRASDVLVGPLEGVQVDVRGHLEVPAPPRAMMVIPPPGLVQAAFNPAEELLIWRRTLASLSMNVTETSLSDLPVSTDQAEVLILPAHTALTTTQLDQLSTYLKAGGGILGGPALSPLLEPLWRPASSPSIEATLTATESSTSPATLCLAPFGPPWLGVPLLTPRPLRVNVQALEVIPGAHVVRYTRSPAMVWQIEHGGTAVTSPAPTSTGSLPTALVLANSKELFSAITPPDTAVGGRIAWMDFPLSQVYGNPSSTTIFQPMLQRLIPWLAGRPLAIPLPSDEELSRLGRATALPHRRPTHDESLPEIGKPKEINENLYSVQNRRDKEESRQIQRLRVDRLHLRFGVEYRTSARSSWVIILPPDVEVTEVISHRIPSPTLTWKQVTPDEMLLDVSGLTSGEALDIFIGVRRR